MDAVPRLLILDVDGTLVRTRTGNKDRTAGPGHSAEADWEWIPGARERILEMRRANPDLHIAIATNQGGVAYGFHDRARMEAEIAAVARGLGPGVFVAIAWGMAKGRVPEYAYEDPLRKPRPGALEAAMKHFGVGPEETVMVGDRVSDREAARAAGCHFRWAKGFLYRRLRGPDINREIA